MARRPPNFEWLGFSEEQLGDLEFLDFLGNNGLSQLPDRREHAKFILELDRSTGHELVKQCMADIGYGRHALQMLDRWYSKGTTGKFGR